MTTLQSAQQAYDNRQPEDTQEGHTYTGNVVIDGCIFEFYLGNLETVQIDGELFKNGLDTESLINLADQKAREQQEDEANEY